MIRRATIADAESIQRLINQFAEEERLLPRSLSEIYDNLRDFSVFQGAGGQISGVCALHICWEGLAEIRSLAVTTDGRKKGVGGAIDRGVP
jgi:amino-acid N-acetyltransferase